MVTSEFSSGLRSASGLQLMSSMKRVAVAMLAMMVVSGCGVGSDEYWDGEKLVSSNGQALEQGPDVGPEVPGDQGPQTPGTTAPSPGRDPGTVALPQDPIPVFEGKPYPQAPPPLMDPFLMPGVVPPTPGIR